MAQSPSCGDWAILVFGVTIVNRRLPYQSYNEYWLQTEKTARKTHRTRSQLLPEAFGYTEQFYNHRRQYSKLDIMVVQG
jgi:hypothetical protein